MAHTQKLSRDVFKGLIQASDIEDLSPRQIVQFFQEEGGLSELKPGGISHVDPRNGEILAMTVGEGNYYE